MVNKSKNRNRGRNVVFVERRICGNDLLVLYEWLEPLRESRKIAAWQGCEICHVLEGYIIHVLEFPGNTGSRQEIRIEKGEISLLNYMQPHYVIPSEKGKFISYNFNLDDKNIPKEFAYNLFKVFKISSGDISGMMKNFAFLAEIEKWLLGKKDLSQGEIDDYFLDTLSVILDACSDLSFSADDSENSPWKEVREEIERQFSRNFTIEELAKTVGLSRFHFIRQFKKKFGCTPIEYLHFVRLNRAVHLLLTGTKSVEEVALEVGFNDVSFFVHKFRDFYGKPPVSIKKATSPMA